MAVSTDFRYGAWRRPDGSLFRAVALDVTEGPKMNEATKGDPLADRYLTPEEAGYAEGHVKRYRTIVADPPWPYDEGWPVNRGARAGTRSGLPYPSMTVRKIVQLDALVLPMVETDAHLFLWTTNRHLLAAYEVAKAWGFRSSQLLTWCKAPVGIGPGGVFANTSEFVVYARRGKPEHLQRVASTWWEWPRGGHSAKPEAFLDLVEASFPDPRLEMFARRARFGWDYWGDESLGTAEVAA